jgi:hypothetical protein
MVEKLPGLAATTESARSTRPTGAVKAFGIRLVRPHRITCNDIAKIVGYCKAARSILVHTNVEDLTLPPLDAMASLPSLGSLRLFYTGGQPIHMVLDWFDLPCLKSLELSRYGMDKPTDPSAPWPSEVPVSQHDLDNLLPPDRYHTGNVTSLVLSAPGTPLRLTEVIMRWPAHLERFSITMLTHSSYATSGCIVGQ